MTKTEQITKTHAKGYTDLYDAAEGLLQAAACLKGKQGERTTWFAAQRAWNNVAMWAKACDEPEWQIEYARATAEECGANGSKARK